MRSVFKLTLSLAVICFSAFSVSSQSSSLEPSIPNIVVTGKAEISVEPDYAIISVDFIKLDKDLEAARKANEEGVSAMLRIAKKYAIPPQDVSTNNISVSMRYISVRERQKAIYNDDGEEVGSRTFEGYEVTRSVTFNLSKLEVFEAVFNDVLTTQPTKVDDVKFESSRIIELREQAREMAMKAAFEKAKAMTRAIGQTVGKAIRINEGISTDRYDSGGVLTANARGSFSPTTTVSTSSKVASFSVGTINIEASVTVVFSLN